MRRADFTVRNVPSWLQKALNLQETNVPSNLVAERDEAGPFATIQMGADAFQGGLGIGEQLNLYQQMNAGFTDVAEIAPADPKFCYLILSTTIFYPTLTAPRVAALGARPIVNFRGTATAFGVAFSKFTVPAGTGAATDFVDWKAIIGNGADRVFVPPGFNVQWFCPTLGVGENLELVISLLKIPAGFKPF